MKKHYLLRIVNRLLKPVRLRASMLTPGQLLTEALVRQGRPITFIQVGANDGIRFDNLYYTVTNQSWSGLVIEPLTKHFSKLANNYKTIKILFQSTVEYIQHCKKPRYTV